MLDHLSAKKDAAGGASSPPSGPSAVSSTSTPLLFILTEFTDQSHGTTDSQWASFITNNIKDYYFKTSHGNAVIVPATENSGSAASDGVIDWVNVGYAHPNTGSSTGTANQKLAADAIKAADPYINYASYDSNGDGKISPSELSIVVVVAGYEASWSGSLSPKVWGHYWRIASPPTVDGKVIADYAQFGEFHGDSTSNKHMATMGIMVHELGHLVYGLPDLYDTDSSSSGVGAFCLMGGGSWGRASGQSWSGESPVNASAWVKLTKGWVADVNGSGLVSVTASGDTAASSSNTVFRAATSTSTQYFLVENRQPLGYDRGLESQLGTGFGGLAIWHIDDSKTNNTNDNNRWVDLEEADGTAMGTSSGSASDLWSSRAGVAFSSTTTPNSNLYNGSSSGVTLRDIGASGSPMAITFGASATSDTTAPTTAITSPVSGATLSGTVTISATASDNVGLLRVDFLLDGAVIGSSTASPYSVTWDSSTASNGSHTLTTKAYDTSSNIGISPAVPVTLTNSGTATGSATYDSTLKAPMCLAVGAACDSGTLLTGRGTLGPESNQPNTIKSACADGVDGVYHTDESVDRIKVSTSDGGEFVSGKTVKVDATLWAFSTTADYLDLYYAADANNPSWVYITTMQPTATGAATLSATYTLPSGSLQAVRANFRYYGSANNCSTGSYNDHDDLIFGVTSSFVDTTAPTVSIASPTSGGTVSGIATIGVNASDDVGVSSVEFLLDGETLGFSSTTPYSYDWDTKAYKFGTHLLTAMAYDAAGNSGRSDLVFVTSEVEKFKLTVAMDGNGFGQVSSSTKKGKIKCGSKCEVDVPRFIGGEARTVKLVAKDELRSYLAGWTNCDEVSPDNPNVCFMTMDGNKSVNATFSTKRLDVAKSGDGFGKVLSRPSGIHCGTKCSAGFDLLEDGSSRTVKLIARPDLRNTFDGWSGCDSVSATNPAVCYMTMDTDKSVTAAFSTARLNLNIEGEGAGTVISNPAGIKCAATCSVGFSSDNTGKPMVVELTATPSDHAVFEGWRGCDSVVSANPAVCVVTMDGDKSVGASFVPPPSR